HEEASAFHGPSLLRLRDDRRAALCMSRGDLPGGRTVEYATVPGPDNGQPEARQKAAPLPRRLSIPVPFGCLGSAPPRVPCRRGFGGAGSVPPAGFSASRACSIVVRLSRSDSK